ncbi:MAG: ABC transporter permease [Planctomycetota bacterium]|nr:MAG: ABC transporter permease [Planctomycetota bacterium]
MIQRWQAWMIGVAAGAFIGAFLLWPVATTVQGGLFLNGEFSLAYLLAVFRNPVYVEGLINAFVIAVSTTVLTTLIAVPLSIISVRFNFPLKGLFSAAVLVPMILPPFVGAIGMRQILGPYGVLNAALMKLGLLDEGAWIDWIGQSRLLGVILLEALYLYPILYLNATAALANVDPAMEEAAENLGCTGLRRFMRITLPLMMPGLFAGGTIVFIWSFTELGTPLMFDFTRVTSVQIFDGIKDIGADNPFPYALVIVMLTFSVLAYALGKRLFGRQSYAMMAKATAASAVRELRGWRAALAMAPFVFVTGLAILPHTGVVLTSISRDWYRTVLPAGVTFGHYTTALGHSMTLPSIANSLHYAGLAMIVDMIVGVGIAWVVVRSNLRWRGALDALAMLPLAVPGMVVAFGYLTLTQEGGGLSFLVGDPKNPDPMLILVIAYAVRRLPYVVRSTVAGLQQTSVALEEAAANLGCPPLRTIRRVTLPLIAANVLAGALLTFSFAMLEVSDSLMLAQKTEDYPITKAIFVLYQLLGEGKYVASSLGVWAMAFLTMTILAVSLLLGRKMGAIFRV